MAEATQTTEAPKAAEKEATKKQKAPANRNLFIEEERTVRVTVAGADIDTQVWFRHPGGPYKTKADAYEASKLLPKGIEYRFKEDAGGAKHREVTGVESERLP